MKISNLVSGLWLWLQSSKLIRVIDVDCWTNRNKWSSMFFVTFGRNHLVLIYVFKSIINRHFVHLGIVSFKIHTRPGTFLHLFCRWISHLHRSHISMFCFFTSSYCSTFIQISVKCSNTRQTLTFSPLNSGWRFCRLCGE